MNKFTEMYDMRKCGSTYQEIGNKFGLSRQGVTRILKKYFTEIRSVTSVAVIKQKECQKCRIKFNYRSTNSTAERTFCSLFCSRNFYASLAMSPEEKMRKNSERIKKYYHTAKGNMVVKKLLFKSFLKYPEKQKARKILNRAVKSGKIDRLPCAVCGKNEGRIEAHHEDYAKPLEVIWLCKPHHYLMDKGLLNLEAIAKEVVMV